jgi:hypothetical protein
MENNNSDQRTERILNSLNGLQRTAAPDFFYTRLIGKIQNETRPKREKIFLLRPAFITTALSLAFIVNVFSLLQLDGQAAKQEPTMQAHKPATIESFADAYGMNTLSVYE